jgi:hypothetical protein
MKLNSKFSFWIAFTAILFLFILYAEGALYKRSAYLVYDSTNDIVWMIDANYAATSGWPTANLTNPNLIGQMTWNDALMWAAQLEYQTYDDWRLPTTTEVSGFRAVGEMGDLYYNSLDNNKNANPLNFVVTDSTGDVITFVNIQRGGYWTSVENSTYDENAWTFSFANGSSDYVTKDAGRWAWAVRDGDIAYTGDAVTFGGETVLFGGEAIVF